MEQQTNTRQSSILSDMLSELQEEGATTQAVSSNMVPSPQPPEADDVIELNSDFDYDGFQVVRREFFAHLTEPSITFNNYKVYVNSACLNKFPAVDYVQALVNQDTKILAIRPCREEERDAFTWCTETKGKRKVKQVTCKLFFAMLFSKMQWNPDYRYKMLGKVIHANGEYLIAFDLSATEVYQRTFRDGEKPKTSRKPVFPEGWQDQFGLPFSEHRTSMQINIFDGYAVYGIKDNKTAAKSDVHEVSDSTSPVLLPSSATSIDNKEEPNE